MAALRRPTPSKQQYNDPKLRPRSERNKWKQCQDGSEVAQVRAYPIFMQTLCNGICGSVKPKRIWLHHDWICAAIVSASDRVSRGAHRWLLRQDKIAVGTANEQFDRNVLLVSVSPKPTMIACKGCFQDALFTGNSASFFIANTNRNRF